MIRPNNDCVDYNRFSGSEIVLQHFCHVVDAVDVVVDDVADSQKQNEMRRFQQKN